MLAVLREQVFGHTHGWDCASWSAGLAHLFGIWQVVKGWDASVAWLLSGLRLRIMRSSIISLSSVLLRGYCSRAASHTRRTTVNQRI